MKLINRQKLGSAIDVDPDDLAAQLTLIDLPVFKSIGRDEFVNSALSRGFGAKIQQQSLYPNVSAMKRQFNQVSFWAVGQILAIDSARQRAELIGHLVKTAKRLHMLNNLHSSLAIVSALLSSPIHRLDKTWQHFNKRYPKERAQFDVLRRFYSDTNNYESLRQHLATCSLPCIPYLGVYSRDIIYINEAYQDGAPQKTESLSNVLDSVERFQESDYKQLVTIRDIHDHLMSNRYIDELQRFVEDENYRRSLEIEPPPTTAALKLYGTNTPLPISTSS